MDSDTTRCNIKDGWGEVEGDGVAGGLFRDACLLPVWC